MDDVLITAPKRLAFSLISKPPQLLDLLNAIAYMLPAILVDQDESQIVVDQSSFVSHAIAIKPTGVGFIFRDVEMKIAPSRAAQCLPDATFFDMNVREAAGLAVR